jgi:hypothetical protein
MNSSIVQDQNRSEVLINDRDALRKHLILHEIIENDRSNAALMHFSSYIVVHDESRQNISFF